ncbi:MAG: hypothetical protein NC818_04065 [Candidatus Omnitrophica bacterium]|nr:hypothetical protein [Candidatus Omnitrophota bacterium]
MNKKIFCLSLCLIFILNTSVYAQNLRVNNKEVEEGETLNLFSDDLIAGKIVFSLRKDNFKKVEITFDKGRNWKEMTKDGDYFIFEYRPLSEEEIIPEFILTEESGSMQTYKPYVKIVYQKKKPDEQVEQVLEKMKIYYEQENIDRFMDLFSYDYPERIKFKEAIQNDFYNYKNIRLRYRIDRKTFDSDFKGAIWDVYWERKYDNRDGTAFSDSETIAMRFDREGPSWLISGMRGNTIFGSALLAQPDLEPISLTNDDSLPPIVTAVIRNNGSTSASNISVKIYSNNVLFYSTTISSLASGAQTTVSHQDYYNNFGNNPTGKVVVDDSNTISETNENNNVYTTTLD